MPFAATQGLKATVVPCLTRPPCLAQSFPTFTDFIYIFKVFYSMCKMTL